MILRGDIPQEMLLPFGYGYGDGDGDGGYGGGEGDGGYGDGYGEGDGGYGDGDYGDGDGGYGGGEGDGGYGDGDGEGDGDGDGDYGDGDSDGEQCVIYWYRSLYNEYSKRPGSIVAYWRSNADGTPANGGKGTKAYIGLVEEISGPLEICTHNALHATLNPPKWKGERIWIVAMYPPFQFEGDKIASLKREIIAEAKFNSDTGAK